MKWLRLKRFQKKYDKRTTLIGTKRKLRETQKDGENEEVMDEIQGEITELNDDLKDLLNQAREEPDEEDDE